MATEDLINPLVTGIVTIKLVDVLGDVATGRRKKKRRRTKGLLEW